MTQTDTTLHTHRQKNVFLDGFFGFFLLQLPIQTLYIRYCTINISIKLFRVRQSVFDIHTIVPLNNQ